MAEAASGGAASFNLIVILAAIIAAFAAALAFAHTVGVTPSGLYTTDYQFLAEGARRILLGQTPHVDFSAPVGPLTFWLLALASRTRFLGSDVFALNILMWAIAAIPAALVAMRLPSRWQALLFVGTVALAVLSPFNLEQMNDVCDINYNGIYNRHGAALLFITFVAGFTRPRGAVADGVLFAWLLGAMFLLKVTYGFAGIGFLGLACLFSAQRLKAAAVGLALLVLAALALEATTGIVSGYLRDVAEMARLNSDRIVAFLWGAFWGSTLVILVGVGLVVLLALDPLRSSLEAVRRGALRQAILRLEIPALGSACVALTLWTESQSTGGPGLIGMAALVFAPPLAVGRLAPVKIAVAGGLLFLTVGWFADQVLRRGRCLLLDAHNLTTLPALDALAPGMRVVAGRIAPAEFTARLWRDHRPLADEAYGRGFDFNLESYGAPVSFVANAILAQEAAERLRSLALDRNLRHVTTLGFVDDFSTILGREPAPGLKLALDPYRTIGALTKEQATAYLAPVDAVFERTCAAPLFAMMIAKLFRPVLEETFEAVVLTPCWTVHLRRGARQPS
jgi:hypothetical protein